MFILALLDVSTCMAQQTQLGLTLLECAKSAVEQLLDSRRKEGLAQRDQYMLVITAGTPLQPHSDRHTEVVCGWHDTARFLPALKAVQPLSAPPAQPLESPTPPQPNVSYLSTAITASLDLLNRYSRPNGIDNFARGRILNYNEPALLLLFTTDQRTPPIHDRDIPQRFAFSPSNIPASTYASTPYRWDQRLYSVVVRLPLRERGGVLQSASSMAVNATANAKDGATAAKSVKTAAQSALSLYLDSAAGQTGGKSTIATSFASLLSHVDGLSKRLYPNVLIHLTPETQPDPSPDLLEPTWSSVWPYQCSFVGVYVKSASVWPSPETYLPEPAMQALPPREPHPTFYFSIKTKPLPMVLLDSTSTTATPTAASSPAPSIAVSSAPPPLPPLESSIPADTYTIDPSAPICSLLLADEPNTCRYLTIQPMPSTAPFGLLYAHKPSKKVYLVLLPYEFPTFFSYLSRIDNHLRSLPLTSSSSAALTSNPALYSSFAQFLSRLPFYYWPAVQAALGRMHRLPRLDVKMHANVAGAVSAEVSENMRRWKEEASKAMAEEKDGREKDSRVGKSEQPSDSEQMPSRKKKRRRENGYGEAGAGQAVAEVQKEIKLRRPPVSAEEAEVEWLLTTSTAEERPLLPPLTSMGTHFEIEGTRDELRQSGVVKVADVFLLSDDDLASAMSEWKSRAVQLMQPFPLLASVLPPPIPPPTSSSVLTLRPRLPPSAFEPCQPIAVMGDFHAYLKAKPPPLREAVDSSDDDGGDTGLPAFGSPYRRHGRRGLTVSAGMDDDGEVEVNERDVAVLGSEMQQTRRKDRWKPVVRFAAFVEARRQAHEAVDAPLETAEDDSDTAMRE